MLMTQQVYMDSRLYMYLDCFTRNTKKNNYNYYDIYNNRCPALFEAGRFYYL